MDQKSNTVPPNYLPNILPTPRYHYASKSKSPIIYYIVPPTAAPSQSRRSDAIVRYRRICSFAFSSTVGFIMICLFTNQPLLPRILFFGAMCIYLFGAVLSILTLPVPEDDDPRCLSPKILRQRRMVAKILAIMTFNASLLLVSAFVTFQYNLAVDTLRAGLISFLSDIPCQVPQPTQASP